LLLAENSGKMDIVTFDGPEMQNAKIETVKKASKPRRPSRRHEEWPGSSRAN
jgi:hypothetical protein